MNKFIVTICILIPCFLPYCQLRTPDESKLKTIAYRILEKENFETEFKSVLNKFKQTQTIHQKKQICFANIKDLISNPKTTYYLFFNGSLVYSSIDHDYLILDDFNEGDVINAKMAVNIENKVFLIGQKATFFFSPEDSIYYVFFISSSEEDPFYVIPSKRIIY